MMNEAIKLMALIERKQKKLSETTNKLKRSLRIKELWPEAFKCGTASIGVNISHATVVNMHSINLKLSKLIITRPDGEHREYPLMYSPIELWEDTFDNLHPTQKRCPVKFMRYY